MSGSLLKNFLKFSYGSLIGLFLGLATTMLTTRLFSPEAFGKVTMFELLLKVGMIITIFGADQAFVRFFYEEDSQKRGALLYKTLRIPLFCTLVLTLIIMILFKPITFFLVEEPSIKVAVWLVIGIFAQLLFRFTQLVIRMQQKGNLYSLIQILQKVFNLSFILILFYAMGNRFEVLILSKLITIMLLVIVGIYIGKSFWKINNIRDKDTKHSQMEIFKFGAPFVLTIFISWLFESFDKIALRQWSDFEELGLYAAAMRLVALIMVVRQTFSAFWTPVAYEKFEKAPEDRLFFRQITIIISFILFLLAIVSIAIKDVLVSLLGSEYENASSIMPFLVFMPIFYTISETTVIGINFYKKTKMHILIAVIACVLNIIGNWALVPQFGALGASISTALSFIIFFTIRTQISKRYYKVNFPTIKIYIMTLIVSCYALYSVFITNFWWNMVVGIIPTFLLITIFFKDIYSILKNRTKIISEI